MRKLMLSALLGLTALLVSTLPSSAAIYWCARDPIVSLNNTEVQIWVAVPQEYELLVNGPIEVDVRTPDGVSQEVLFLDSGFNGYGEVVTFGSMSGAVARDGSFPVKVRVRVPIDQSLLSGAERFVPLLLEIDPANGPATVVEGTNDGTWVTTRVKGTK